MTAPIETYRNATEEERREWGGSEYYDLLVGPDGFQCFLGEPEDRCWHRDGRKVVEWLNLQHQELIRLRDEVTRLTFMLYERERRAGN